MYNVYNVCTKGVDPGGCVYTHTVYVLYQQMEGVDPGGCVYVHTVYVLYQKMEGVDTGGCVCM